MNRISIRGIAVAATAVATSVGVAGISAATGGGGTSEASSLTPLRKHARPTTLRLVTPSPTAWPTTASPTPTITATRTPRATTSRTAQAASRSSFRKPAPSGDPRAIARAMVAARGWSDRQFGCLDDLWTRESGWQVDAGTPDSGAYGIPQALPGSKMASAGDDWRTSARTQIRWGLGYIADVYGTPCAAWSKSQSHGWY